uniref:Uncharacterized protein n=1 Tax=Lepeophtheirus salmonis TaxID=72036 RepID=A0A0K2UKP0_LEPSM
MGSFSISSLKIKIPFPPTNVNSLPLLHMFNSSAAHIFFICSSLLFVVSAPYNVLCALVSIPIKMGVRYYLHFCINFSSNGKAYSNIISTKYDTTIIRCFFSFHVTVPISLLQ